MTVQARRVGLDQWLAYHPIVHDKVVFVPHPTEAGKFVPRMDLRWLSNGTDRYTKPESAGKLITRRGVTAGLAAGSLACGVSGFGVKPASAGFLGVVAEFLARTFGEFCEEVAARTLVGAFVPSYDHSTEAMQQAGYQVRNERGWVAGSPLAITMDDAYDTVTIVSGIREPGCSPVCMVEPDDTHAFNSCLDPQVGLPALYARAGHRFEGADAMRYAAPVAARQRRGGPCGNVSVYVTAGRYVVEIEVLDSEYARVGICNPTTGRRLENEALPLDSGNASTVADAGEWKIV